MPHSVVRRIRSSTHDHELVTTRIYGNGWSWDCSCGAKGGWEHTREAAMQARKSHVEQEHQVT